MLAIDQKLLDLFVIVQQIADELSSTFAQLFVFVGYALKQHFKIVVV